MNWTALRRLVSMLDCVLLCLCFGSLAFAQGDGAKAYLSKPVRIIVGLSAGGSTDIIARMVAQKMTDNLGQPFVVENKPGAATIIAAEFVAKAPADGYTLLMAPTGTVVNNVIMFENLPYSIWNFVSISMAATFSLILTVNQSSPIRSIKDLLDWAKANPAKANHAASTGFELVVALFNIQTGTRFLHIPYKASNESIAAVMAGDAAMTLVDAGAASGALKSGKLRALAVTSPKRLAAFPEIPTMAELGFPGLEIQGIFGLFAPAGTPTAIVNKVEGEAKRVVNLPDITECMNELSVIPEGPSSKELAQFISTEVARWSAVAKASNNKPSHL